MRVCPQVLNLALNLFEKYYLDRSFDRSGQMSIVVSPGAGVFEVDRLLAHLTRQRTVVSGIGSDLVCMGEQPLHAVPLFKYPTEHGNNDFGVPHWLNYRQVLLMMFLYINRIIWSHTHVSFMALPSWEHIQLYLG
jgi:hypothetical protein